MTIIFIIFLSRVSRVLLVYTEAVCRAVGREGAVHYNSRLNRW